MKTAHTTGTWKKARGKDHKADAIIIYQNNKQGRYIAHIIEPHTAAAPGLTDEDEANANLIIAAPDLKEHANRSEAGAIDALADVDAVMRMLEDGDAEPADLQGVRDFLVSCRDEARNAITKAEVKQGGR